ncbi:divalent-cation tolerance protein CutA [Gracilimonas mengyeensis]|uniref:Divalent cation tolerance protein n=1 Tax=Gracilimonas mengyeensis TaxID=1302730 RepID=A0A521CHV3_9BACT|nr:divalent-cation tolerance protein CutA [Gracilimonas mengyeensis]SMO59008.1 divalent cation tolerance protein [Gracilimonas mengyeensis]
MYKNLRLLYITTKDLEEARTIGQKLVEQDLAACANILDGMESIYKWKGELQHDQECVLLIKTHYSRVKKVTRMIKDMHSYECPAIISLTITEDEGNQEYLEWLEKTSKQPFEM